MWGENWNNSPDVEWETDCSRGPARVVLDRRDGELADLWRLDREFLPAVTRDEAATHLAAWRRAVDRSREWVSR